MIIASPGTIQQAESYLLRTDPNLAPIIQAAGPCTLRPHQDYYRELVESIIGQQLSLKAAAAIEARFVAFFEGTFPQPQAILAADPDDLRAAGLSRAKVVYIRDLSRHVLDGTIILDRFDALSNPEIIKELTAVKGIGEWTVHMFLIFCMGRLDVLPVGDLGIKNGIRALYGFEAQPTAADVEQVATANNWHPYESVASWYVWRSLELELK
ncbi:MAG TPA: DNA-3-methyladenine glycosylase [Candidatus Saccharimonadales bacterium]|nr:DNA-3-methyladenine glycosylase [Candidatus Saccharimonadales bacterium]